MFKFDHLLKLDFRAKIGNLGAQFGILPLIQESQLYSGLSLSSSFRINFSPVWICSYCSVKIVFFRNKANGRLLAVLSAVSAGSTAFVYYGLESLEGNCLRGDLPQETNRTYNS